MVKDLWGKYKTIILYLIFGVGTTLTNIVTFYLCTRCFKLNTIGSTVVAWIVSVFFAYVTNRKWVFESKENTRVGIINEIVAFFSCRLVTGIMDVVIMFLLVDVLKFNDMLIKVFSNILVIILNYIASKLLIFKKK